MSVSESLDNVVESEPASAEELVQTLNTLKSFFEINSNKKEYHNAEGRFMVAGTGEQGSEGGYTVVWHFLEPEKSGSKVWRVWTEKSQKVTLKEPPKIWPIGGEYEKTGQITEVNGSGLSFLEVAEGENPKAVFNSDSAGTEVKRGDIGQPAITRADLELIQSGLQ